MTNENPSFGGLRVGAFESRQAGEIGRLIERAGGTPLVSPSMREVPVDDHRGVIDFAHRLITGQIDCVVILTGVGFRQLLAVVERHVDRQRFLDALTDVVTVARGPKSTAALREVGVQAKVKVPEPNTWRDLLTTVDRELKVLNQTIAIQEYGKSNPSLIAGLEARGAQVVPVQVYRWELPENPEPLFENVRRLAAGQLDVVMFTSAQQIVNLLSVAEQLGVADAVRRQFERMAVVSVGPTTSETLRDHDLPVDIEPEHPKMGPMVLAAARRSRDVIEAKRRNSVSANEPANPLPSDDERGEARDGARKEGARIESANSGAADRPSGGGAERPAWYDSPFMRACRREPNKVTPVWLMRQAGRYMAEYREVRAKVSFLELCKNPALCAEVMDTAVRRIGVDAAIIFSDLLPILEPLGFDLEFAAGDGPVIHNRIRSAADVDRVRELESIDSLQFVPDTVRETRRVIPSHIPVIGFSGSPFTLASYAIEGGSSRNYAATKTLMYTDEGAWRTLMERLARAITLYLNAQADAGAQCLQLFDSWVGCLGTDDYRRYVLPYMQQIVRGLRPGVPVINFGTGNPALLPFYAAAGSAVVGVDWRVRLDDAWRVIGYDKAVQGNLDPVVLLATPDEIRKRAREVLEQAAGRPGHIFNLGHGILPQTPVDNVIALIDEIHSRSS